ncbi:MAG: hypothetical protein GY859_43415, partial [Desulfobacterales bacterium]|nr:hypothetical protein [Desulfobacterales bacterium]
MMETPIRDILFIRQYPTRLDPTSRLRRWRRSVTDNRGASVRVAGREITFFFPGLGKKIRRPHPSLVEKLASGRITDIVDIGGGGALDPNLRRGDLVLSAGDVLHGSDRPMKTRQRGEMRAIGQLLAKKNGRAFYERKILTSGKVVLSRKKRIDLFEKTGCAVVQMEHCRFLRLLQKAAPPGAFNNLYVAHMEIVADVVPRGDRLINIIPELFRGVDYCILRNQH